MAESSSATKAQDRDLLEGLRKGLGGRVLLEKATGGKDAFFPSAKAGQTLLKRALDEELIEKSDPPPGQKASKSKSFARLSAKGEQFILESDSPKQLLEELLPLVRDLASTQTDEPKEDPSTAIRRVISEEFARFLEESVRKTIEGSISKLTQAIDKIVPAVEAKVTKPVQDMEGRLRESVAGADGAPDGADDVQFDRLLKAVEIAATKALETTPPMPTARTLGEAQPAKEMPWLDDVLLHAQEQKRLNPYQALSFPQMLEKLHEKWPDLKIEEFHEGLRVLYKENRVRLHPYAGGLATIPHSHNALFLDREVKFYVDLP